MIATCALLISLLAPLAPQSSSPAPPKPEAHTPVPGLLDRISVIGASLSAGAGLEKELQIKTDLGVLLFEALRKPGREMQSEADFWFFRDPHGRGIKAVEKVLASKPTLVVALDFLFWFSYGSTNSIEARLAMLERGLALLGRIECPILIADLPDMSIALEGKGPFGFPLVTRSMVPMPGELQRLNKRIKSWANERGDVMIAPLAHFMAEVGAGKAVAIRGQTWPENSLKTLIQSDLLHPTLEGCIGVVLLALDTLVSERKDIEESEFIWTSAVLRERVMQATQGERDKIKARQKRKDERRKRLDEAKRKREEDGSGGRQAA